MTTKQISILTSSILGGVFAVAVILGLLIQPQDTRFATPVEINWDQYTLANTTDQDISNRLEYYAGTMHVDSRSYAIGGQLLNQNSLPVIVTLDDTGEVIDEFFFGLDKIVMDDNTYQGDVVLIRNWPEQKTMLVMVDINPYYIWEGQSHLITGPLSRFLNPEQTYGAYLRLLLSWNPQNDQLQLLYTAGEVSEANPYYDLYDVIPDGNTVWLGFSYDPARHTLDFQFDNPRPTEEGNDYLLQRFQFQSANHTLVAIENENWVLASSFQEYVYFNPGFNLYQEVAALDGVVSLSVRGILPNGVDLEAAETWIEQLMIVGFDDTLMMDLKAHLLSMFQSLDPSETNFSPVFDVTLLLDLSSLTILDYVLDTGLPYAGKIYQGTIYQHPLGTYFIYSIRYYGQDPNTFESFYILKTYLYELDQGGLSLLEAFDEEDGFFAEGCLLTESAIILYGVQVWGLTESQMFNGEVKLLRYEFAEGDYDDYVINSSEFDFAFDVRVNMTNQTVDFYAYVANGDEDFAELVNGNEFYMTVAISFAII